MTASCVFPVDGMSMALWKLAVIVFAKLMFTLFQASTPLRIRAEELRLSIGEKSAIIIEKYRQ